MTPAEVAIEVVAGEARDHRLSDPVAADRALLARSTTVDGPGLVAQRREQEATVAAAWPGGPTGWWVAPLATRLLSSTADSAEVEVWFAEVIAPPALTPMGDWRVTTVNLRQEAGRWLVAGLSDRYAPVLRTRSKPPASPEELATFVEPFEAVDHG